MSATTEEHPVRRLRIAGCQRITSGAGKDGRPWTLYAVEAFDQHGKRILEALRSFEELDAGAVDVFRVERREHERYGTSFVLRRARGRLVDRVEQLEAQLADHEHRLERLEAAPPY
jgi:hypothetical protein